MQSPDSITPSTNDVTGLILAGGQARRMGGNDKGLLEINGVPMIKLIADQLAPQCQSVLINANRNCDRYESFGFQVIVDSKVVTTEVFELSSLSFVYND